MLPRVGLFYSCPKKDMVRFSSHVFEKMFKYKFEEQSKKVIFVSCMIVFHNVITPLYNSFIFHNVSYVEINISQHGRHIGQCTMITDFDHIGMKYLWKPGKWTMPRKKTLIFAAQIGNRE